MAKAVADQFAETLAAAGVKRIYGIVGDSLNGLTDAIRRQGKIEWVHVRHEEVAAFAAGAEAHLTGELAVAPGAAGRATCTSSTVCSTVTAPASRARHRRADPIGRDRQRLFSGDPPGVAVPGVQPLLRTGFRRRPDAARTRGRDPRGRRQRGVSVLVLPGDVAMQAASDARRRRSTGCCRPRRS